MKLSQRGTDIVVTLSRRNLQSLLAKLDGAPEGSARTLVKVYSPARVTAVNGHEQALIVYAEEDASHYQTDVPGPMHPDTERVLLALRGESD